MKIEVKNIELQRVIIFLENLKFKGIGSIHRTKIANHLSKKLDDVAKGEKTIREDFKGDKDALIAELTTYFEDVVTVSGDEFVKPLTTIKNKIKELTSEDSDVEFDGEQAFTLNLLYEAFQLDKEEK